ncbi:MAG: STAS domain-containing protein [Clostridiales bacterium]|nr:STAS domain-containing protein [Clostridiales bacterium]
MLRQMQYDKEQNLWSGQLHGDLDAVQAPKLVASMSASIEQQPAHILLDCRQLDFVDSMGLGALVKLRKLLEGKGYTIKLINLKPRIQKLFVITNLEHSFGIEVET